MTKTEQAIANLGWWGRLEWWLDEHDAALKQDLVTYYLLCALVGTIQGIASVRILGALF